MAIDPAGAGMVMGGNILSNLMQGDQKMPAQVRTYTGMGAPQQVSGLNQLMGMLMAGGGDFGEGAATRQSMATMKENLAQRGIDPSGGNGMQALAQMMSGVAGQNAANRGSMMLQAINSRPWTYNYQNLGVGMDSLPGAARSTEAMDNLQPMLDRLRAAGLGNIAAGMERQIGNRYRTGGTYAYERA